MIDETVSLVNNGDAYQTLGLVHRVRPATLSHPPHPTLILSHGLYGNEDVTWVFARAATRAWLITTPRAPLSTGNGGHAWYQFDPETGVPDTDSVTDGVDALDHFIDGTLSVYKGDRRKLVLAGFSQGAAMSLLYAIRYPDRVAGVVSMGGFIPHLNKTTIPAMNGLPVLILHGTHDEVIPVKMAQKMRDRLTESGAAVTYDESEIGHKVSAQGLRKFEAWLADRLVGFSQGANHE
jgi:phospholipase/carboxylesterase